MKIVITFAALFGLVSMMSPAEARHRHSAAVSYAAHPDCNILWPCEGVAPSARGSRVVRAMGGLGSARKVYVPARHAHRKAVYRARTARLQAFAARAVPTPVQDRSGSLAGLAAGLRETTVVSHPAGCPARAFCGCGAAVRVFGAPIRYLWLAANWLRFPRTAPAPGMVAARRGHVFVLERHISGNTWLSYDANSGRHLTRIHARSIDGYAIVDPRGAGMKESG